MGYVLSKKLRNITSEGSEHGRRIAFWCPGCDGIHAVTVEHASHPVWGWNGNVDFPTFTPSILTRFTKLTDKGNADIEAWREAGHPKHPEGFSFDHIEMVCHSYVTDGRIQYLSDCTHDLAGKTVELPDWPLDSE